MVNSANNAVWSIIIGGLAGLLTILLFPSHFRYAIIVLNGVYIGSMCGILIAYWRLVIATLVGAPPFDRARQYALGVFYLWTAYNIGVFISVFSRTTGVDTPSVLPALIIASRYMAIIAAWLQVTAPDFGQGFFAGRDRKVLWIAVSISVAVSIFLIFAQNQSILS